MPAPADRPHLRPGLAAGPDPDAPGYYGLWDDQRFTHRAIQISAAELEWAQLFDGRSTAGQVRARAQAKNPGVPVTIEAVQALIAKLDNALMLDSDNLIAYLTGPVRDPSCLATYGADPRQIARDLNRLFTAKGGPGMPEKSPPAKAKKSDVRAVLVPHMDYDRGGVSYGWGFKELFDRTAATVFVIVATSHYSGHRFTLTRQNFRTPLGDAVTNQAYVDSLVRHYGDGLFDDPGAHLPEHSIELEVVLLQHLYAGRREFTIVPLLVGPMSDAVRGRHSPGDLPDVQRMVRALQAAESECPENVCYVISGDLAHVGPKFDDPEPVAEPFLAHSMKADLAIVEAAESANPDAYFDVIAAEQNVRRICGLSPTWLTLAAARPSRGRLLNYGRYVHPEGYESVSFASMAFDA